MADVPTQSGDSPGQVRFTRSFSLPRSVDPDRIRPGSRRGVLTVHMSKTDRTDGKPIRIDGAEA